MNKEEEIKKSLLLRDRVLKVLSKDGHYRVVCVKNSKTAFTAQNNHNLDSVPAIWMARMLSGATLAAALLKGEERVTLEVDGNGQISKIFAEAMQTGEVRGFMQTKDPSGNINLDKVEDLLGIGLLRFTKILYNKAEPVQGVVHLQTGDITTDLTYYYQQSEQIPTAIILDCKMTDEGIVSQSGGLMIQVMPGYSDAQLLDLYESINSLKSLTDYFEDGLNPLQCLKEILPFEFDVLSSTPVDFFCRCSKENFISKLMTLGKDEIIDMERKNHNEIICQYCNKHYYLTASDFKTLTTELIAKNN